MNDINTLTRLARADAPTLWRPCHQLSVRPDAFWREWLLDSGSLTERLDRLSAGTFRVNVIDEGWCFAGMRQMRVFSQDKVTQLMWSRRVQLCLYGQPWVAAHSLIPYSSLVGAGRQLVCLKTKPLGRFLFHQSGLQRGEMEVTRLNDEIWGRRSLFYLAKKPILVAEFFWPAMPAALAQLTSQ
ncbi:chorismate pyruvate-lyase [Pseudohongiella nitratireducens]|uniref:Probable chorismate pyruvate-lyase n=1 Tax=Pseudohongiella nitratireducens TaxID=1768907 RepID=A0A917GUP0_9GAMM|nr:chorismate lyase [Pseudohongiella nitratireducens]MDF1623084.1 chorismate lyase [Pseudohongiella nitratireducens]GGG57888.1 chorismate pyruvate-lyase [Pseudohongiella nitratireducens]